MPEPTFTSQELGRLIFRTLGVTAQDEIEVQRDKLNPNRIQVIRYPKNESGRAVREPRPTSTNRPTQFGQNREAKE